jgi:acetyltransferase-like isoleucine patch superfamily enzyme
VKALREVGAARLARHGAWRAFATLVRSAPTPFARAGLLRLGGARVGPETLIMAGLRLENLDRHRGAAALSIGRDCYVSFDVHVDLAADVRIGDQVSIGPKTIILTHLNVGYADHPLQGRFPTQVAEVEIGPGSFVAAGVILLPGTRLGPETFVAAGSVVKGEHPGHRLLAGSPARPVRTWGPDRDGHARNSQAQGRLPHLGQPSA